MIGQCLSQRGKRALTVFVKVTSTYPVFCTDMDYRLSPEQRQNGLHPAFVFRQGV